jgi:phosphatidylglycerol:prolipoprotein diacylglycerol transferase
MKADPASIFAVAYGPYRTSEVQSYGPVIDGHALIELRHGSAPQFDLGLLELSFTIVLALLIAATWSRRLTTGTYIAVVALSYGPVRFVMDFLRIKEGESADLRYGSLTFAQWCCVALTIFGLYMVKWVIDIRRSGKDPLEPLLRAPDEPEAPAAPEAPPA